MSDYLTRNEFFALKSAMGLIKTRWRKKYTERLLELGLIDRSGNATDKGMRYVAAQGEENEKRRAKTRFINEAISRQADKEKTGNA